MNVRKSLFMAVIIVLLALLSFGAVAAQENITVSWWTIYTTPPELTALAEQLAQEYMDANPGVTIAFLPVFIQVRQLGLIDSYFGVILPLVAFGIPGSTLILRGFFRAIPSELEDAAYIDGCGTLGFFWFVLLPLARPALGAIIVLQTIVSWNEYFLPLLVLTDDTKWPLTLGIMQFQGQYGTDWGRVMAFVSLLIVPAVLFYVFTQRYIVTGLTGGELKG
jgi:raffinose/stachyose/melibiose transport system permease protein